MLIAIMIGAMAEADDHGSRRAADLAQPHRLGRAADRHLHELLRDALVVSRALDAAAHGGSRRIVTQPASDPECACRTDGARGRRGVYGRLPSPI